METTVGSDLKPILENKEDSPAVKLEATMENQFENPMTDIAIQKSIVQLRTENNGLLDQFNQYFSSGGKPHQAKEHLSLIKENERCIINLMNILEKRRLESNPSSLPAGDGKNVCKAEVNQPQPQHNQSNVNSAITAPAIPNSFIQHPLEEEIAGNEKVYNPINVNNPTEVQQQCSTSQPPAPKFEFL